MASSSKKATEHWTPWRRRRRTTRPTRRGRRSRRRRRTWIAEIACVRWWSDGRRGIWRTARRESVSRSTPSLEAKRNIRPLASRWTEARLHRTSASRPRSRASAASESRRRDRRNLRSKQAQTTADAWHIQADTKVTLKLSRPVVVCTVWRRCYRGSCRGQRTRRGVSYRMPTEWRMTTTVAADNGSIGIFPPMTKAATRKAKDTPSKAGRKQR